MLVDHLLSGDTTSTRSYELLETIIPAQWPPLLALAQHRDPGVREARVSTLPLLDDPPRPGWVDTVIRSDREPGPKGQRPCLLRAGSAVARGRHPPLREALAARLDDLDRDYAVKPWSVSRSATMTGQFHGSAPPCHVPLACHTAGADRGRRPSVTRARINSRCVTSTAGTTTRPGSMPYDV